MDLTSRFLRLFGLETDFSISLADESLSRIGETLYVGGRPRPEDIPALEDAGITHVVSCLEEAELSKSKLAGFEARRLEIALRDGIDQDIAASFPALFEFASRAGEDPRSRLLVHCEAGVSRSATLATALLMKTNGQTFIEAFAALRAKRPRVLPNIGFASQLQRLEHTLHPERRAPGELSSLAHYLRDVCRVPVEVAVVQEFLEEHDYDAQAALLAIFGGEIPRVVQGVRL